MKARRRKRKKGENEEDLKGLEPLEKEKMDEETTL